jgi:hypothetical protein
MKTIRLIRGLVIFTIPFLFVIATRESIIIALFSIGLGFWVMAKLFNVLFGPSQGFGPLTVNKFLPDLSLLLLDLMNESTSKGTFHVIIWWSAGILSALISYKLLMVFLVP